jgi:cytochrome P450
MSDETTTADAASGDVRSDALTDEWCRERFDYTNPEYIRALHPTLARMRAMCPVAHSSAREGFWALTKYEDVLRTAQDWETFSSELGVGIPHTTGGAIPAIPEHIDPPLQRIYKKLISGYFTPSVVRPYEQPTRDLVTSLIDGFIESSRCDFMVDFAKPFPGLAFFDLVLDAPQDELGTVAALAQRVSTPNNPTAGDDWMTLTRWISAFIESRRDQPPKGDVVDAVVSADIDGRPITETEILGIILLLILGGLDTTAGVLGQAMLRFIREPEIPALLRRQPELIPAAVEELLRLEGSFVGIGRTVRHDAVLAGKPVKAGEKVFLSWASANRDEEQFADPDAFDLARPKNPHLAFGAGPHRCVGSNLARLNLRIAIHEIVQRLDDIALVGTEADVPFHSAFNRSPLSIPITFRPGPRIGSS